MDKSVFLPMGKTRMFLTASYTVAVSDEVMPPFAMTKDGKKIFTSNVSQANVSVIDVPGKKLITQISTGGGNSVGGGSRCEDRPVRELRRTPRIP